MAPVVKVAGVQMDVALGEVEANLAAIIGHLREAAAAGALVTVFPECAVPGYCFHSLEEARKFAQPVPGPAIERLASACRSLSNSPGAEHGGPFVVTGMLELDGERIYNTSVLVGPTGLVGKYRKIHLPFLGVDRFTTPGERPPEVFACGPLRVGMNICYDGSFPEASRCLALAGADLIALPTNWPPGGESTADYIINARALENHVYFLAVDRVGDERGFHFIGKSRLADPRGGDVASLLHDRPGVILGEVDVAIPRNKHLVRVPGAHEIDRFQDRRPELYERLTRPIPLAGEPTSDDAVRDARGGLLRQLWAPWRLAYVAADAGAKPAQPKPAETYPPSFIAEAAASNRDRENLVVYRGKTTIVILNRFPYNNGHLLVCPLAQKARLEELTAEERLECQDVITRLAGTLERLVHADGFNIGLNLGRVAGAGVPGHLHWHVVPRWNGDCNFMTSVAGMRVIPQSLEAMWELLTPAMRTG